MCSAMAGAVARRWWAAGAAAELPTCVSLLHGAWPASLHPAQGTGLLRLQVPTCWSVVAGARTRRATRPSARVYRSAPVYAWGLFVPAGEAASVRARRASKGRAVWPARSSAARRCGQARAHPRARPQLVGVRAGLTLHPLHSPDPNTNLFFWLIRYSRFAEKTRIRRNRSSVLLAARDPSCANQKVAWRESVTNSQLEHAKQSTPFLVQNLRHAL